MGCCQSWDLPAGKDDDSGATISCCPTGTLRAGPSRCSPQSAGTGPHSGGDWGRKNQSPHLEFKQRWINQFNFYLHDKHWGRMFVRVCPYFPFSARVCLNQHHWLAIRMRQEGIDFQQSTNAFLKCDNPTRLQELADSLTPQDLLRCGQKWLAAFTPFISDRERRQPGCQHRLFFSQVEYCDNLIFHRRAAVDELTQRLLDLNRTIGQPKKITMIFGRKVTKEYKGKVNRHRRPDLPNPVIRCHYGHAFAKQYVRDDRC